MSSNNSSVILPTVLFATLATGANTSDAYNAFATTNESVLPLYTYEICEKATSRWANVVNVHSTVYSSNALSDSASCDISFEDKRLRYASIINSFNKHKIGFPEEKEGHIVALAEAVCKLQFNDNVSYYNEYTETIDTVIQLSTGLTLSISQFLSEDADSPVVFSIHLGQALLVSDEMPINDIVNTINAVPTES